MKPIYSEAQTFIETMYDHEILTFQTASKNKDIKPTFKHGTLDDHWEWLVDQNSMGANIYIMVNEGDGRGRSLRNVRAITSVLVDLDGSPLDPVLECDLKPRIITETSENRFQGLWRVERIPVTRATRYELDNMYKRIHDGISKKFNADPARKGLSHVCRLPGFINHNHKPFVSRVFERFPTPQISVEFLTERVDLDLTQPTVQPYRPLTDSNGVPVNLTAGDPILKSLRNEMMLRICFRLAYQEILGDELTRDALEINAARCRPPLGHDEVTKISRKVTSYFARVTDDQIMTRITDYNTGMRVHNGHFYRYDPSTTQYRLIDLTALRSLVYRASKFTANDGRIKHVLKELYDTTRECEHLDNPERQFIRNCITVTPGGKAILGRIHESYKSWCEDRQVKPVSKASLSHEIKLMYPGTFSKSVRVGVHQYRGFYGLSLRELLSDSRDDSIPLDFTYIS